PTDEERSYPPTPHPPTPSSHRQLSTAAPSRGWTSVLPRRRVGDSLPRVVEAICCRRAIAGDRQQQVLRIVGDRCEEIRVRCGLEVPVRVVGEGPQRSRLGVPRLRRQPWQARLSMPSRASSKKLCSSAPARLLRMSKTGTSLMQRAADRKSTRLNSSHVSISYA